MAFSNETPIPLIVGAGPTGMMMSLWLQHFNITHRIVDAAPRSATTSRAMVMHARSLELYRQLGLAQALIAKGRRLEYTAIHYDGQLRCRIPFGDCGKGLSKYPFFLSIPQDIHEAVQEEAIVKRGGKVERNVNVVKVEDDSDEDFVHVTLSVDGQQEHFRASYVIGCDGARSSVRHSINIDMEGGTYNGVFFVADVIATGIKATQQQQMNIMLSQKNFLLVLPLPQGNGQNRLIGFVPSHAVPADVHDITFDDVRPEVRRNMSTLTVEKINWFSAYKVHHRTATHFQKGRVFLCGDAAHIHSPVGGQGMNTGLGDASNLAWKLAAVSHGAHPSLLDTYEVERQPFAQKLVNTTDYAFTKITSNGIIGHFMRVVLFPYILPFLFWLLNLGPTVFRRLSQIELEYELSPMSSTIGDRESKTTVLAGDRLPWVENAGGPGADNHACLDTPVWQAHVYGTAADWVVAKLDKANVRQCTFSWTEEAKKAGLRQDALYLVRPDGYIGLIAKTQHSANVERELDHYLQKWSVGTSSPLLDLES